MAKPLVIRMFVELGIIHELDRFPDRTPYVVIIAGPCRRRRKVSTGEVEVKESAKKKEKIDKSAVYRHVPTQIKA